MSITLHPPVIVAEDLGHVKVGIGVVEEDVEGHLCPLLLYDMIPNILDVDATDLDVLDEDCNLHGAADLPPDGGDSGGVDIRYSVDIPRYLHLEEYDMRVFMVTPFWMTRAVMGISGSTS